MRIWAFLIFFSSLAFTAGAQCPLSSLGQNPSTAFPVCGTQVFHQETVPLCQGDDIYTGCTDGALYANRNPYWYKFTCFQSGTLGFLITPLGQDQDYDWQLFDITDHEPDDVYTDFSLIVTGNWSGSYGTTGTRGNIAGSGVRPWQQIQCSSSPDVNEPRFETMPPLVQGHNYLLLISHFTEDQSGYDLSFGGGTANITDPLEPHLKFASAPCDGQIIRVVTNKKMKCKWLEANGSDFLVTSPAGALLNPVGATSLQCSPGFDLDTISVQMAAALTPGTYRISMKNGDNDNNTLLDNCDRAIPVGEGFSFTVYPLLPTPLDSITVPKCEPQTLELVFKKNILCNTIAPDGSDFTVTGPYAVTVTGARGTCDNNAQTFRIFVDLSAPLQTGGNFFLNLQRGSDENTIIDECGQETPPASLPFVIKDTVNAVFSNPILYTCALNTINYNHNGAHGVNYWHWTFGTAPDSYIQNPTITYTNFEPKTTTLIVSNGVCSDTTSAQIVFDNFIKADFEATGLVCPEDKAVFKNLSKGTLVAWKWTIGNGSILTVQNPVPQNYVPMLTTDYVAHPELIVQNNFGCFDTISKPVQVIYTCYIAVPSAFTPDGDGLNDFLYPLKAYKSTALKFSVFNRFGQRMFYSESWTNKWDGKFKGLEQPPGTYIWMLEYTNTDSGKKIFQKGASILIR